MTVCFIGLVAYAMDCFSRSDAKVLHLKGPPVRRGNCR